MGVWFNQYENVICREYCNSAELVELGCLESFRFNNPWSKKLEGKKVLVVHPFEDSIKEQYFNNRTKLFNDPNVLPAFELKTIKAVQSLGSKANYNTWFEAYDHMCRQIEGTDFDVAIIGAGAYGLPLAAFIKKMGKCVIHMGGATQILFGIKGTRWEIAYKDSIAKLFNDYWIRPLEIERPSTYKDVENGCYW